MLPVTIARSMYVCVCDTLSISCWISLLRCCSCTSLAVTEALSASLSTDNCWNLQSQVKQKHTTVTLDNDVHNELGKEKEKKGDILWRCTPNRDSDVDSSHIGLTDQQCNIMYTHSIKQQSIILQHQTSVMALHPNTTNSLYWRRYWRQQSTMVQVHISPHTVQLTKVPV